MKESKAEFKKEITFDDLTISEAIEILTKIKEQNKKGMGLEVFSKDMPTWTLSMNLMEKGQS